MKYATKSNFDAVYKAKLYEIEIDDLTSLVYDTSEIESLDISICYCAINFDRMNYDQMVDHCKANLVACIKKIAKEREALAEKLALCSLTHGNHGDMQDIAYESSRQELIDKEAA